ncbi:hypothetical protein [Zunongwangia pacifica]|uniref:Uncharacterized protein n=1 Tax=Zunongwangia pacifica TaxID=2911062 RepID=A0A9X2CNN8_9FLAO|nr:hypothetical protein [Zunongwangia pacifica]MCL6220755.1 hypothetical protein [Zunongwangia pacifica]
MKISENLTVCISVLLYVLFTMPAQSQGNEGSFDNLTLRSSIKFLNSDGGTGFRFDLSGNKQHIHVGGLGLLAKADGVQSLGNGGWRFKDLWLSQNAYVGNAIAINTRRTSGYNLAVNGRILANEITVKTGWADFVFDDDYQLPDLYEVEDFIKENGHLEGIPTAIDIEENGADLGAVNVKLLQKIEELTLYTIEQHKEIMRLKKLDEKLERIEELLEKNSIN